MCGCVIWEHAEDVRWLRTFRKVPSAAPPSNASVDGEQFGQDTPSKYRAMGPVQMYQHVPTLLGLCTRKCCGVQSHALASRVR